MKWIMVALLACIIASQTYGKRAWCLETEEKKPRKECVGDGPCLHHRTGRATMLQCSPPVLSQIQAMEVLGQAGSPFSGQKLTIFVAVARKQIRFEKPIFHPNVNARGQLSYDTSRLKRRTHYALRDLAEEILNNPVLKKPYIANLRAADILRSNRSAYFRLAKYSAR